MEPPLKDMARRELVKLLIVSAVLTSFVAFSAAATVAAGPEISFFDPAQALS